MLRPARRRRSYCEGDDYESIENHFRVISRNYLDRSEQPCHHTYKVNMAASSIIFSGEYTFKSYLAVCVFSQ
jgi:hypothetical protein